MDPSQMDPEQMKARINMEQQQVFLQQLMNKLREECFTRCITSPGRELSSRDQSCLNNCVDRYLEGMKSVENAIAEHSQGQ